MYTRDAGGRKVVWRPKNEAAAEQAMSEVVDRFDEWNGTRYELDNETARAVNERYREILEEGQK